MDNLALWMSPAGRGWQSGGVLTLDSTSRTPAFEQVRAQIAGQITGGSLVVGSRLPTVRRLADDLGLAINTVARAYRELEAAGLIETRGRAGTVVSAGGDQALARAQAAAREYAALARGLGVSAAQAVALVQAAVQP